MRQSIIRPDPVFVLGIEELGGPSAARFEMAVAGRSSRENGGCSTGESASCVFVAPLAFLTIDNSKDLYAFFYAARTRPRRTRNSVVVLQRMLNSSLFPSPDSEMGGYGEGVGWGAPSKLHVRDSRTSLEIGSYIITLSGFNT